MSTALSNIGQYNKFIVAVLGAISVGITAFAGTAHWAPAVLAAITAITAYLVPNTAPATAAHVAAPVRHLPATGNSNPTPVVTTVTLDPGHTAATTPLLPTSPVDPHSPTGP